ncbi:hypothetical protein OsI_30818 [Oryza sativa Indica Group]|uniref:Uncharacterized protein n=1 Tax=Oryza sativa subsp. indica TaxID=39946 RepID=B8BE81_ORYSI|nr:hypothetical protein OsI_30818 [Oryza sativa Indica Group]
MGNCLSSCCSCCCCSCKDAAIKSPEKPTSQIPPQVPDSPPGPSVPVRGNFVRDDPVQHNHAHDILESFHRRSDEQEEKEASSISSSSTGATNYYDLRREEFYTRKKMTWMLLRLQRFFNNLLLHWSNQRREFYARNKMIGMLLCLQRCLITLFLFQWNKEEEQFQKRSLHAPLPAAMPHNFSPQQEQRQMISSLSEVLPHSDSTNAGRRYIKVYVEKKVARVNFSLQICLSLCFPQGRKRRQECCTGSKISVYKHYSFHFRL